MLPETDQAAIQADAYIDALLAGHGRAPVAVSDDAGSATPLERQPGIRDAIRMLENGLPRFHPSFVFEEWLGGQIRRAADTASDPGPEPGQRRPAEIVSIVIRPGDTGVRTPDRRLLVGGAIASGVSIASAAVIAWRRTRHLSGSAD